MNSSRFSEVVLLLVAAVLFAGVAGAVTVSETNAPDEAKVDNRVTARFDLTELYTDYEEWTLEGETELENVTWTITTFNQADSQLDKRSYDGETFTHPVDLGADVARVRVEVTGIVPGIGNFSYDPPQSFLFTELRETRQGGTSTVIETYDVHHYTERSREARQEIDDAAAAIERAGGNPEAERLLDSAISAYGAGNFDNAVSLAQRARERATQAQQSQQRTELLLYGGIGVVVLGAIVGGLYWYRSRRTASKL